MKAFPCKHFPTKDSITLVNEGGMDLRDYFAAKAMLVVKASDFKTTAEYCYRLADAMMKAREE